MRNDRAITQVWLETWSAEERVTTCPCGLMKRDSGEKCQCGKKDGAVIREVWPARGEKTMGEWCDNEAKAINSRGGNVVVKRLRGLVWLELGKAVEA
jgi:hypothetical protein